MSIDEATKALIEVIDDVCLASGDGEKAIAAFRAAIEDEMRVQMQYIATFQQLPDGYRAAVYSPAHISHLVNLNTPVYSPSKLYPTMHEACNAAERWIKQTLGGR